MSPVLSKQKIKLVNFRLTLVVLPEMVWNIIVCDLTSNLPSWFLNIKWSSLTKINCAKVSWTEHTMVTHLIEIAHSVLQIIDCKFYAKIQCPFVCVFWNFLAETIVSLQRFCFSLKLKEWKGFIGVDKKGLWSAIFSLVIRLNFLKIIMLLKQWLPQYTFGLRDKFYCFLLQKLFCLNRRCTNF